jgi:hypothetical protein
MLLLSLLLSVFLLYNGESNGVIYSNVRDNYNENWSVLYIYSCVACEYAWICSLNIIAYYKIITHKLLKYLLKPWDQKKANRNDFNIYPTNYIKIYQCICVSRNDKYKTIRVYLFLRFKINFKKLIFFIFFSFKLFFWWFQIILMCWYQK